MTDKKLNVELLEDRNLPTLLYPLSVGTELATPSFGGNYTPAQVAHAYGFDQTTLDGSGQTIAIVDAFNDPNLPADLQAFDQAFNLAPCRLTVLNQTAGIALPAPDASWALEEALDVEWAHAMAPGASIVLVEAASNNDGDLFQAVRTAASLPNVCVVSMSWGTLGEVPIGSYYDSSLQTPPGHSPVAFVTAAGDGGTTLTGYPAYSPDVLTVGGTTLSLGPQSSYGGEQAWSKAGGGLSLYEPKPAFQASLPYATRAVPDVSYDADPNSGVLVRDSFGPGSGWWVVGGTSAGAPQWSSIVALADQARGQDGRASLDNPTLESILYAHPQAFRDVTAGGNGTYQAGPGYDLVTGLGSPNVPLILDALAGSPVPRQPPSLWAEIVGLVQEDLTFVYWAALAGSNPAFVPQAEHALFLIQHDPFAATPIGRAVQAWVAQQLGDAA